MAEALPGRTVVPRLPAAIGGLWLSGRRCADPQLYSPALDLRSLTIEELRERVARQGEPPFRAEQVFRWLHGPGPGGVGSVRALDAVSNFPRSLRDALLAEAPLQPIRLDGVVAAADGTRKFRFRTYD